jgi:hypothetical protein
MGINIDSVISFTFASAPPWPRPGHSLRDELPRDRTADGGHARAQAFVAAVLGGSATSRSGVGGVLLGLVESWGSGFSTYADAIAFAI